MAAERTRAVVCVEMLIAEGVRRDAQEALEMYEGVLDAAVVAGLRVRVSAAMQGPAPRVSVQVVRNGKVVRQDCADTATFERMTAKRAYVRFGTSAELIKFEATSERKFTSQLQVFCAERGATKLIEVRT